MGREGGGGDLGHGPDGLGRMGAVRGARRGGARSRERFGLRLKLCCARKRLVQAGVCDCQGKGKGRVAGIGEGAMAGVFQLCDPRVFGFYHYSLPLSDGTV